MSDSSDLPVVPSVNIIKPNGDENKHSVSKTDHGKIGAQQGLNQQPLTNSTGLQARHIISDKNSSEASNVSKEKQSKGRSRTVQSRFRAGLSGSKNNSNSKNGSSNNISSNGSNSGSLNCTVSGSLSSSGSFGRNKTLRGGSSARLGVGKSMVNVAKTTGIGQSITNLTSHARPAKSIANLTEIQSTAAAQRRANSGRSVSSKLHSTVLAERTLLGSTHNIFSTTVVCCIEPGRKKCGASKKFDVTSATLPELPDISAIRLDSVSDKSGDTTVLSAVSEKDSSQESSNGEFKEVNFDDLQKEYLRYLQSAYIDAVSDEAFDRQLDEVKTQLVFLDQLTSEKQSEVSDRKQKLELTRHHQNVYEAYKEQTEQLHKLVDCLPASEDALNVLTVELEKNLHQVKMDNLHIPENHKAYRDELQEALQSEIACLKELECLVEPRSHQLLSTVNLLDDLQNNTQRIQQYEREVNQAARLAIQEASLLIGDKQMNNSCI